MLLSYAEGNRGHSMVKNLYIARLFKAYQLYNSKKKRTTLKSCADDLFYATPVQQGELISRWISNYQDCFNNEVQQLCTCVTSPQAKKPADPGNRQQNRIASDKEHRDSGAVFVQQVSKPAASAKKCRLFLPLVSSAFLAYIKILKQVLRNILAQTYSKIPCRYPGAYTGTQRRKWKKHLTTTAPISAHLI